MAIIKEFKEFASKGNVIDMAVGIIIGGAFGKIVASLVADVIMPPIGLLLGKVDFSNLYLLIADGKTPGPYASLQAARDAGAVAIGYGSFINTVISFLIVAWAVFMLVKGVNSMKRKQEAAPPAVPTTKDCPHCCTKIPVPATRCPACTSQL